MYCLCCVLLVYLFGGIGGEDTWEVVSRKDLAALAQRGGSSHDGGYQPAYAPHPEEKYSFGGQLTPTKEFLSGLPPVEAEHIPDYEADWKDKFEAFYDQKFKSPVKSSLPYLTIPADLDKLKGIEGLPEATPIYQKSSHIPDFLQKGILEHGYEKYHPETMEDKKESTPIFPLPPREEIYVDQTTWPCFYKQCRGRRQSPINIDSEVIKFKPELGPLKFENFHKSLTGRTIANIGFAMNIQVLIEEDISVTANWLNATYRLFKIGFDWSNSSEYGSSHTVDGKYYPLEMVMFFLNTKYKTDVDEPDALLCLLAFFKVSKQDNYALNAIIENFNKILYPDTNTTLKTTTLTPADLLPKHTDAYITYNGSRLTIPCSENIQYIVFDYANTISEKQLQEFRRLRRVAPGEKEFELLEFGLRPIQPLNNRPIWGSVPASKRIASQQKHKKWW